MGRRILGYFSAMKYCGLMLLTTYLPYHILNINIDKLEEKLSTKPLEIRDTIASSYEAKKLVNARSDIFFCYLDAQNVTSTNQLAIKGFATGVIRTELSP